MVIFDKWNVSVVNVEWNWNGYLERGCDNPTTFQYRGALPTVVVLGNFETLV
jgi:hypothetical protein